MGNVYVVHIGKYSRRGDFLPQITRYVDTDESVEYKIRDHFAGLYVGFDVKVAKAERVEILKIEPKITPPINDGEEGMQPSKTIVAKIRYLTDLEVEISDDHKAMYSEALRLRDEFRSTDSKLRKAIAEKISKKEWLYKIDSEDVKINYEYGKAKLEKVSLRFDVIKEKTVEIE